MAPHPHTQPANCHRPERRWSRADLGLRPVGAFSAGTGCARRTAGAFDAGPATGETADRHQRGRLRGDRAGRLFPRNAEPDLLRPRRGARQGVARDGRQRGDAFAVANRRRTLRESRPGGRAAPAQRPAGTSAKYRLQGAGHPGHTRGRLPGAGAGQPRPLGRHAAHRSAQPARERFRAKRDVSRGRTDGLCDAEQRAHRLRSGGPFPTKDRPDERSAGEQCEPCIRGSRRRSLGGAALRDRARATRLALRIARAGPRPRRHHTLARAERRRTLRRRHGKRGPAPGKRTVSAGAGGPRARPRSHRPRRPGVFSRPALAQPTTGARQRDDRTGGAELLRSGAGDDCAGVVCARLQRRAALGPFYGRKMGE